ncbi:cupredoxin domain-containing protein [Microvirga roseola]|uniref:cupredoxin domain-containing protein n=1 Tax=Microvirga roseola TaxID=2883126 RepID=UPI001E473984|nr:cupredoxin domain-containing protein [Microvirga roseola]
MRRTRQLQEQLLSGSLRLAVLPALAGLAALSGTAAAQTTTPSTPDPIPPGVAPVEVSASIINGNLQCRPPQAWLPTGDRIALHVTNRAEQPVAFVAPKFFRFGRVIESSGFTMDLVRGGFLVAPQSTVQVTLVTPVPGEYYYSCYQPGHIPTPQTSGFFIVVPPRG